MVSLLRPGGPSMFKWHLAVVEFSILSLPYLIK